MGVVNVTPDSFSDGGQFLEHEAAIAQGHRLFAEGAAILDIGGESTRPGAEPVPAAEQLRRVLPVVRELAAALPEAVISIDTASAEVAGAALAAGARMVNDVTALRGDAAMADVVAGHGAVLCLMHMQGEPRTMQQDPHYEDVLAEVAAFLRERVECALAAGVAPERLLVDPGIGFGKTVAHNLVLLRGLADIVALGHAVLVGPSRKSFLGSIVAAARRERAPVPPAERLSGTIATCVMALERGAEVFRVHDVAPVHDALAVAAATLRA
jgi:dihydropteroate synthase